MKKGKEVISKPILKIRPIHAQAVKNEVVSSFSMELRRLISLKQRVPLQFFS